MDRETIKTGAQLVVAVAGVVIALFAYCLNQHVYDFQQKSLALQTVREFASDARSPGQKFGLACIRFVLNNIPEQEFKKWWGDHDPQFLKDKWRDAGDCIPPPYAELKRDPPNLDLLRSFSSEVYFQVARTLNSYEIYLARISRNVGDTSTLCNELPVIKD
ncbi:MAG: hypothetical protein JOY71_10430 [Acetobacteraceae bacterium]|nr:hypothetical protein [Acetobacteraceae bacterium]